MNVVNYYATRQSMYFAYEIDEVAKETYLVIDLGIRGGSSPPHAILRRMGQEVTRTWRHEVSVGIDGGADGHQEKGGKEEEGGRSASEARRGRSAAAARGCHDGWMLVEVYACGSVCFALWSNV